MIPSTPEALPENAGNDGAGHHNGQPTRLQGRCAALIFSFPGRMFEASLSSA